MSDVFFPSMYSIGTRGGVTASYRITTKRGFNLKGSGVVAPENVGHIVGVGVGVAVGVLVSGEGWSY